MAPRRGDTDVERRFIAGHGLPLRFLMQMRMVRTNVDVLGRVIVGTFQDGYPDVERE